MASTTLASIAAATAAGYKLLRVPDNKKDINAKVGAFTTVLELPVTGQSGEKGFILSGRGEGTTQAAADTAALAALNAQRIARYGTDTTSINKDIHGVQHTVDKT